MTLTQFFVAMGEIVGGFITLMNSFVNDFLLANIIGQVLLGSVIISVVYPLIMDFIHRVMNK